MSCADDPAVLSDEVVASRSARLLQVAEETTRRLEIDGPVYVIGTEVPVPGGAHETLGRLTPTPADRARRTIDAHRLAFAESSLDCVWPRVVALVVQPGVEFDHLNVIDYERSATVELRHVLDSEDNLVFEAHSTDYQRPAQLRELVEDHWAILKVGPALTFAMREALFGLAQIEGELVSRPCRSNLIEVIERRMLAEPEHWQGYYDGDPLTQRTSRRYSYSDRLRYYWADDKVDAARQTLLTNLDRTGIPLPLISQFLPGQYDRIRAGDLEPVAQSLVIDRVRDAMRPYARACRTTDDRPRDLTAGAADV
jgi:D-tagatose-1,6-bisphosphate aldolase subunit GatZ/KbaZ